MNFKLIENLPEYALHKKNYFKNYFEGNRSSITKIARVETLIKKKIQIKDFVEKNIDIEKIKLIGKATFNFFYFYLNDINIINLIKTNSNLIKLSIKNINSETKLEDIENIITQDIEKTRSKLNERQRFFFDSGFGYKTDVLTLEQTAINYSENGAAKLTRERVRQVISKINKSDLQLNKSFDDEEIYNFLQSNISKGFHALFPNLQKCFTKTAKHSVSDNNKDRFLDFLEAYPHLVRIIYNI
jgi:hypothetical protein